MIAAVLGVGAIAAGVVLLSGPSEVPAAFATEADLPAIPTGSTNGWTVLNRQWSDAALSANGDATMALIATDNEEASFESRWESVVENAERIRSAAKANVHREPLEAWHRAAGSERFADACTAQEFLGCRYFDMFKLHQLVLVEVLGEAVDGRWSQANTYLADALSLDRRFLASCRNSMSCLVSASMLADTLAVSSLVLQAQPVRGADVERKRLVASLSHTAEEDAIDDSLGDFEVKRRAFVGDYLSTRYLLHRVQTEGVDLLVRDSSWPPSFLFSAARTAKLIDDVHLDLRSQHGMHLMLTGRDEDAAPTRCTWSDRIVNAIGCAHFDPEFARESHDSAMMSIDESLAEGHRWSQRIAGQLAGPGTPDE